MAIGKNPRRTSSATTVAIPASDREAEAFIAGAGAAPTEARQPNKQPIMVRIDPDLLQRIDRAAKRLGISRSAFIVSSTAERLERME